MSQGQCAKSEPPSAMELKAKATAVRYQRYIQSQCSSQANSKFKNLWSRPLECLQKSASKCWNLAMPLIARGPATPYESLLMNCTKQHMETVVNLTLCQSSIQEAITKDRLNVLITYRNHSLSRILQKIDNNQQINALINKKANLFLAPSHPQQAYSDYNETYIKIGEFMDALPSSAKNHEQVLVLWKGLYQQILIIAHFSIQDFNLYLNVIKAIEEREDYEEMVKKIVYKDRQKQICNQQQTMNYLSEQSTGVSGSGED